MLSPRSARPPYTMSTGAEGVWIIRDVGRVVATVECFDDGVMRQMLAGLNRESGRQWAADSGAAMARRARLNGGGGDARAFGGDGSAKHNSAGYLARRAS